MSVFFCIETTLLLLEFSSEDWEKLYTDFPSKTTKVHVKDKSKVLVSWDQSRITSPIGELKY